MLPAERALASTSPIVRPFAATLAQARALGLALLVAVALVPRVSSLGASGFSEDEINKLRAVSAYDHLDFSANAEHPMMMKLADWAAISAVRWWDAHVGAAGVPVEAALRLPNAIVGTATTAVVFLLAETLFDTTIAAWAAAFWALDANAASINRIGKEDTLLVFFLLLAAYCYERAKAFGYADPRRRQRWYGGSAAAFGLMLASKYMPHYFGLHALFNIAADRNPEDKTPDKRASFFIIMAAVFAAANFALLLPATWRYLAEYANGDLLLHSGYDFAHRIYVEHDRGVPVGIARLRSTPSSSRRRFRWLFSPPPSVVWSGPRATRTTAARRSFAFFCCSRCCPTRSSRASSSGTCFPCSRSWISRQPWASFG